MPPEAVLHYGMGFDSTALLLDYLLNPQNWDFVLRCIVMSQTGDESFLIKQQVEKYVFPLLRQHKIRTIQIARASSTLRDGFVVLDDTTEPEICHYRPTAQKPYFSLSDDMLLAATVPQYAQNRRKCSDKFKQKILDKWHDLNCPGCWKLIGYNGDEAHRFAKIKEEWQQQSLHPIKCPLYDRGWSRSYIEDYIKAFIGSDQFYRSACVFCPFSMVAGSNAEIKLKYDLNPREAVRSAYLEYVSICFNSKQTLSSSGKTIAQRGLLNEDNQFLFELELAEAVWKVYEVRRIRGLNIPYRSIKTVFVGSRETSQQYVRSLGSYKSGEYKTCDHGIERFHTEEDVPENCEFYYVAAPGDPRTNERPQFAKTWAQQQTRHIKSKYDNFLLEYEEN